MQVVHHREHRLLELAGVARAADEDHALGEVEHDERAGARAVPRGIGLDLRRVQHREVRREARRARATLGRMNMLRTNAMCHAFGRHVAHGEPVRRIGAAVEVLRRTARPARSRYCCTSASSSVELLRRDAAGSPSPSRTSSSVRRLLHDELVVRRAAGVRRRDRDERPHVRELALAAPDRRAGSARARRGSSARVPLGREPLAARLPWRERRVLRRGLCGHRF